jgi:hypothetical protein
MKQTLVSGSATGPAVCGQHHPVSQGEPHSWDEGLGVIKKSREDSDKVAKEGLKDIQVTMTQDGDTIRITAYTREEKSHAQRGAVVELQVPGEGSLSSAPVAIPRRAMTAENARQKPASDMTLGLRQMVRVFPANCQQAQQLLQPAQAQDVGQAFRLPRLVVGITGNRQPR